MTNLRESGAQESTGPFVRREISEENRAPLRNAVGSIRQIETLEDAIQIRDVWNSIVSCQSENILQLDVTSTFEWTEALWRSHLESKNQSVLLLEKEDEIAGIFPLMVSKCPVHRIPCRKIAFISEVYSGRCGFLLRDNSLDDLEAFVHYLFDQSPAWDVFSFTLVDGSKSADLISELVKQAGYQLEKVHRQESPFILLAGTWQNYFASLPKKFRWLLRDAEKKLKASGELRYSEYSKGSDLEHFLTAMFQIEQKSWKEEQGSSITANERQREFYTTLTAIAGQQGLLSCHLLELNREPIAYIYGLFFNGVFSDLKESYNIAYQSMSPGHALKLFALQRLHERGARLYDYMGVCEPYKMRWTDKTYVRSTYIIYNRTLPAFAARTSGMLVNYSRSVGERFHRVARIVSSLGEKTELRPGH